MEKTTLENIPLEKNSETNKSFRKNQMQWYIYGLSLFTLSVKGSMKDHASCFMQILTINSFLHRHDTVILPQLISQVSQLFQKINDSELFNFSLEQLPKELGVMKKLKGATLKEQIESFENVLQQHVNDLINKKTVESSNVSITIPSHSKLFFETKLDEFMPVFDVFYKQNNSLDAIVNLLTWAKYCYVDGFGKYYPSAVRNFIVTKAPYVLFVMLTQLGKEGLRKVIQETDFFLLPYKSFENDNGSYDYDSDSLLYRFILSELELFHDNISPIYSNALEKLYFSRGLNKASFQFFVDYSLSQENVNSLSVFFNELPLQMNISLSNENKDIQIDFKAFLEKFHKINSSASIHQQVDSTSFFFQYATGMMSLIHVYGVRGIHFMEKQLAFTALTLQRKLERLGYVPYTICIAYKEFLHNNKLEDSIEESIELFGLVVISIQLNIERLEFQSDIQKLFKAHTSLNALKNALVSVIVTTIFGEAFSMTQEEMENIVKHFNQYSDSLLITASRQLKSNRFENVFLQLLYHDLLGKSIDPFLHDVNQPHPEGSKLAEHNQNIQKLLTENGISSETALQYKKTDAFVVTTDSSRINPYQSFVSLLSYIKQLNEKLNLYSDDDKHKQLKAAIKYLGIILKDIEKHASKGEPEIICSRLTKKHIRDALEKATFNISLFLEKKELSAYSEIREFFNHVSQQYTLIKKAPVSESNKKVETHYIEIKQWDKTLAETFFLGNHVGCCLATDGAQFQAMVQRRMDDAMLFHVACDLKTNQPVALIWLYLAVNDKDDVVLIANFFEVNTKYAQNDMIRKALFHSLIQYTHQYCNDNPNIKGFYMGSLKYGWNTTDITVYPKIKMSLKDKLGGAFKPETADFDTEQDANSIYYLQSLKAKAFYQSSAEVFVNELKNMVIKDKKTLLTECMTDILHGNKKITFDSLITQLIDSQSLILLPFYNNTLKDNPMFEKDVMTVYKALSSNILPPKIGFFSSKIEVGEGLPLLVNPNNN